MGYNLRRKRNNVMFDREKLKETDEYKRAAQEEEASRQQVLRIQDEENMKLKDQVRMEVRKELSKLEMACIDMASLLRSLGILIGGSLCPKEVHAAYKRALLRFHPDRASKTDILQQVEAEEKFKLISRMKEKSPCH
ncbi:hypothetical protein CCACVL1_06442 [Corchorus capsularis]|uniref:J domain-containing protein n=1 Tax=Corchorus capsularis TaxID=210143 RepID=A0A1R3JFI6_COCAP|nr:hypothetical protein CCACVL1_06442 [Corchorus capsularis]